MANIENINLDVGRATSSIEFAEITITVSWTAREVSENQWYILSAYVVERDDGRDFFDMLPSGEIHWSSVGNLDDFIGTIRRQWVRPNGASRRTFRYRRNWDFGNQEGGSEEYLGIGTIIPETRGDIRFTREVSANLG